MTEFDNKIKKGGFFAGIFDHLFFLRPLLILPIWAPLLLGYVAVGGSGLELVFIKLLLLGIFLGGGIYGLNQIYDVEGDRINRKNLPLSLGLISPKAAWAMTILCDTAAVVIGFWITPITGILTPVAVFMGFLYSLPRFRFKDSPWLAVLLNGLGHGALVYVIGWSSIDNLQWQVLYRMLPYALAFAGVYIATTIPDIVGDRATGKITLAVAKGAKTATIISYTMIGVSAIGSMFVKEPAVFLTGLFASPFYVFAAVKGGKSFVTANKMAVLLMNLWVCFYAFPYIVVLIVVIAGSRIYFSIRLNEKYP